MIKKTADKIPKVLNLKLLFVEYKLFTKSNNEKINFNKFTFPTLIITGEKDINSTPKMSMKLHKEIKNSQIKIIKSMKHMAYYEKSKLVNLEIKNFLK